MKPASMMFRRSDGRTSVEVLAPHLILPFVLLLSGCGDTKNNAPQVAVDSTARSSPSAPADSPSVTTSTTPPDSTVSFEERVFRDYASQGVAIPRRVTDSIVRLNDPRKMEEAMNRYMRGHDSLVRESIVNHYGISLDSLDAIIRTHKTDESTTSP